MPPTRRSFRHWSPRYLVDRARDRVYQATHPGDPWLTPAAVQFLSLWLRSTDRGLEFGSGRSTLWFARRTQHLTSIEHAPEWHARVSGRLRELGILNVDLRLVEKEPAPADPSQPPAYAAAAGDLPDSSLDYVLVDGAYRDACALAGLCKLKPGGLLILDDAHRYLPSRSISPYARTLAEGPASPLWGTFLQSVSGWRCLWTSKGVSDTAVYIRP